MKTFINYEILNFLPVLFFIKYKNNYCKQVNNKINYKLFSKYIYFNHSEYLTIDF